MTTFEGLTVAAGLITAGATTALAIFAYTAFRSSVAQLRLLAEDSARQTRPYVSVDLAPGLHGGGFWDLVIENTGRSIARGVRIDAGQLNPRTPEDHISEHLREFLAGPLTLPPGARRRVMWRMEAMGNLAEAGAGTNVNVEASYTDDQDVPYTDRFVIAVEPYRTISPMPTTGPNVNAGKRTDSEVSLANIERALRTLNTHVGMLRS